MNTSILSKLKNIKSQKIGKLPVVVLSLEDFETMKENLEMYQSKKLLREIVGARKEKKTVSLEQLLKKYHL